MRPWSWPMRARRNSCRCLAASYSAFSLRSPWLAASCRSFGTLRVSSYCKSASSFFNFCTMGKSMTPSLYHIFGLETGNFALGEAEETAVDLAVVLTQLGPQALDVIRRGREFEWNTCD